MSTVEIVKGFFLQFGSSWVLWLLLALSIGSLAIVVERALFFRGRGENLRGIAEKLDASLQTGEFAGAIQMLQSHRSVAASIASAGLRLAPRGAAAADKAMQSAAALERSRLERGLAFLGTLGNNAPFIGLFGTVIGVIEAFEHLGAGHAGEGANTATTLASQAVMSSIAEALVATAVGILVALPAVAANNYFQRRLTSILDGADVLTNLVLAYLSDKSALVAKEAA
ncbi:MAG: MotA/TolQ/ExbB proton channel family protein [Sandaracinaceae bacterium]|jgi:biopolymer transport protein ExbB|nr:MotA/TolQ/ExbB proton channel family protein [Sandaracinaceae bacterium]